MEGEQGAVSGIEIHHVLIKIFVPRFHILL